MLCSFCKQENRDSARFCHNCGKQLIYEQVQPLNVFICYEMKDEPYCEQLEKHLAPLEQKRRIKLWNTRKAMAGSAIRAENERHLNAAHVILLLISADFLASDYCYNIQTAQAMQRYRRGETYVIPVLIRPALWQEASFGQLQALPSNEQPVTNWQNQDQAFVSIVEGIRKIVEQLIPASQNISDQWRQRGNECFKAKRYNDALAIYEQALYVDADAAKWCSKGDALLMLERYREASSAYAHAIHLDIDSTLNHIITDGILHLIEINHYEHIVETAIQAISQGIQPQLQPEGIIYLSLQAIRWSLLKDKEKTFHALNQAALLKPEKPLDYFAKATVLLTLERRDEALTVFGQAIQCEPQSLFEYFARAVSLIVLDRRIEAFDVFKETLRLRPTSFLPYIARLIEFIMLKDRDEALKIVHQTFGLRSNSSLPHLIKVVVLLSFEEEQEAMVALHEIPSTNSNFVLISLLEYIIFNTLNNQQRKVLEIIERFIQRFPACAFSYVIEGETLYKLQRYKRALEACDAALRLNPQFSSAYYCLGDIHKQLGNHKKSARAYAKAKELSNNFW